ncbi:ABC transporter ATP-binding protein [Chelativorans sp.]|uniref:ABC transporter ATP-binding protein n=1 Tax=Chelativorans sp. TaxID=2203393 RepID=UPI002811A141|nr:ABC transporter ATP-binding protein [Chelativorans sp.]
MASAAVQASLPLAVETQALTKRYGGLLAVDAVSLAVPAGAIYGFLGPNGAGKTSVLRMLLGLLPPDGGSFHVLGIPFGTRGAALRRRIGALQEKPRLYPDMTGLDYLAFFGRLYGLREPQSRAKKLLAKVGLAAHADLAAGAYSRGMQQKLCIARTLMHDPELLVLDEPASGLDPRGLAEVRELLLALRGEGRTIILSSHHLSETEKLCDRVGIMSRGRLVAEGTVDAVSRQLRGLAYAIELGPGSAAEAVATRLAALPFVASASAAGEAIEVELAEEVPEARAALARAAIDAGGIVLSVTRRRATLEELFLALTRSEPGN